MLNITVHGLGAANRTIRCVLEGGRGEGGGGGIVLLCYSGCRGRLVDGGFRCCCGAGRNVRIVSTGSEKLRAASLHPRLHSCAVLGLGIGEGEGEIGSEASN